MRHLRPKVIIKSDDVFVESLDEYKSLLNKMGFARTHFERKGYAVFTEYTKEDTKVEFMCGPSDWHVEMIIVASGQHYAFKELLQIPVVSEWIKRNKFSEGNESYPIKAEVRYFINLLEFVLPILE